MTVKELRKELEKIENQNVEVVFSVGKPSSNKDYLVTSSSYHEVIYVDDVAEYSCSDEEREINYCEISINEQDDDFLNELFS